MKFLLYPSLRWCVFNFKAFVLVVLFALPYRGHAQTYVIETATTALVLKVDADKKVYQSYFGQRLDAAAEYDNLPVGRHEAYITAGMSDLFEPAMQVNNADGNPSLLLLFDKYEKKTISPDVIQHILVLKDPQYTTEVSLIYEAYQHEDIIKTWTSIKHTQKKAVVLKKTASSMLHFDSREYWLTQFFGDWAEEMKVDESKLSKGIKIIETKLGTRAHMYQTPVFFVATGARSTENEGEVVGGTLAWSGNFQFQFEIDERNSLRVISGLNPYASEYSLEPGKIFTTPAFIFSWSNKGKGEISRRFHSWARANALLNGDKSRLVLLNNWEATYFDFDEKKLTNLFKGGKEMGVDLFLLDDGWFGNKYPRNGDNAGLGDWQENKAKLPNGIGYLVKEANATGLKFGIWLEPEMVNPKSELNEQHPDWVLSLPNREQNYFRNQLVLDLTNPKVQDFVFNLVDGILSKHGGVEFIKWDCNRMLTNTFSPYLKDKQSHIYIDYVKGLYQVLDRIRAKYPAVPMMLCSGGGGRVDYGALKYFTEFWPSDDTEPTERVKIQWGYSYFFPAIGTCNHVTSWGNESLKYKTDVAMSGKLGYDIEVSKLSAEDLAFTKESILNYKKLSDLVWYGNLFRLVSPHEEQRSVIMYVSADQNRAVLFNYNLHVPFGHEFNTVKLQGLNPTANYTIHETNLMPGSKSNFQFNDKVLKGDYLMKVGIPVSDNNALTSRILDIAVTK